MSDYLFYEDNRKLKSIVNRKRALKFTLYRKQKVLNVKVKRFTGIQTITKFKIFKDNLVFDIDFKITTGKAKLILTNKDQIILITEQDLSSKKEMNLIPGTYRLRLVGIHADIDLFISML